MFWHHWLVHMKRYAFHSAPSEVAAIAHVSVVTATVVDRWCDPIETAVTAVTLPANPIPPELSKTIPTFSLYLAGSFFLAHLVFVRYCRGSNYPCSDGVFLLPQHVV